MLIEAVELVRVAMPLVYPFRTAFGNDETIESVFVRLRSGGVDGWGEAASWRYPAYSPECAGTQFVMCRDYMAPLLLGADIASGQELQERLAAIKGNYFAKAGFDLAWWDLHARLRGLPLWKAVGGRNPVVSAGADFGIMESVQALCDCIQQANASGYKRIKLKYRPGWDLHMLRTVRQRFPDTTMHIDCNSAYTIADLDMFKEIDTLGLAMIEQPLAHDDLIDHAVLQAKLDTPICLDETITSVDKARKAIRTEACRWINIKPGRVGGVTNALAIHDLAMEAGVPCWIGGMLESAVGARHCLALATLPNIKYPSDIFPSDRFYVKDLATPPMRHSAPGEFRAGAEPGAGAVPEAEAMDRHCLDRVLRTTGKE